MSRRMWTWSAVLLVMGALSWNCLRVETGPSPAYAAAAPAGWEYQTASVDAGSLTVKLIEFGRDGWDVFSIVSVDAIVDNAPDGKPHVITQRFEVTGKKPK